MGPVYATRLAIFSDSNHPAATLFDECVRLSFEWFREVAERYGGSFPDDHTRDAQSECHEQASHFTAEHFCVDDERAWRATGVHPFLNAESNLLLRTELQVRDSGSGETVVTIRLLLGSTIDSIRPRTDKIRPPRLIRRFLDAYPGLVSAGNLRATDQVTAPRADELDDLFHKITDTSRMVPIVLFSRLKDESLAFPQDKIDQVARDLAGLARVYTLPDYEAGYLLTRFLNNNKRLSCYLGAMRIYWPGFSLKDSPYQHPLWTITRIEEERLHRNLAEVLFGTIATAAAHTIGADTATWSLYRSYTARKQEESTAAILARLADASAALEQATTLNQTVDELLNEASAQITALSKTNKALNAEVERLEGETGQLRSYNQVLQHQITTASEQADIADLLANALSCRRLVEIVELVQSVSSETYLCFLPDAFESARNCSYAGDLMPILEMLLRVKRVARRYNLGDPLGHKALFEDEGEPGYKAGISDTAKGRYRADYEKRYGLNGHVKKVLLGPHLSFGGGSPTSSVDVYWYVDTESRKYVVGHVGRHLRGKQDT